MIENRSETHSENVAKVQELYAAFSQRDIPAILAVLSPEVEWGEPENPFNPAAGTRHGHAGFLEWAKIGNEAEEVLSLQIRQILTGGDTVCVIGYTRCRARATGKTYETDFVHIVTFANGQVTRFQEFFDTYAAGEAFRAG